MGVILGGDFDRIPVAANYASALGRAFQIIDDILDVTGSCEELGKPIGSDDEKQKSTYVSLLGLDKSKAVADELTQEALQHLEKFDDNDFLRDLTKDLLKRRS